MKNLIILMMLLASCTQTPTYQEPDYEVVNNPQGGQSVYINNGRDSYWMDYVLFQTLMNNGGRNNVNQYYNTHKTVIINNQKNYVNYKKPVYNKKSPRYNLLIDKKDKLISKKDGTVNKKTYTIPSKNNYSKSSYNIPKQKSIIKTNKNNYSKRKK